MRSLGKEKKRILPGRIIMNVCTTVGGIFFLNMRINIAYNDAGILYRLSLILYPIFPFSAIKNDSFHVPGQSLHGFTVVR